MKSTSGRPARRTRRQTAPATLLAWYPPAWRERYGDELAALMEDALADGAPTRSWRRSVAVAGLRERAHEAHIVGPAGSADERRRAGALTILCGFALFVVAGMSFAKASEQYAMALRPAEQAPRVAFGLVAGLGAAASLAVLVGAAIAAPALLGWLRSGGLAVIRRPFVTASAVTTALLLAVAGLATWAHHLTYSERNGNDLPYTIAFLACAVLVAATVGSWTAVAVKIAARLPFDRRVLRAETGLAIAVMVAMAVITASAAVWWATMASDAPSFFGGGHGSAAMAASDPELVVAMALMVLGLVTGAVGARRIVHTWRAG